MRANRSTTMVAIAVAGAAVAAAPGGAAAQSAMGLRAGVRHAQLDAASPSADGAIDAFLVGGYFGFGLSDRLGLQLEVVYGGRGSEAMTFGTEVADGTAVTAGLDMSYLDVPVLLRAGFPGRRVLPSVFVGPYFGFMLSCELTPEGGETRDCDGEESLTARFTPRSTDIGLVVGGAVDFLLGESSVFIDARYTTGLLSIEAGDDAMDARHTGLAVSGGFAFPVGR